MGFEVPVGILRALHLVCGLGFPLLAAFLKPSWRSLGVAWLLALLLVTLIAVFDLLPVVADAGPQFGVSVAALFGAPFAVALAAAIGAELLARRFIGPSLGYRVAAGILGYGCGLAAAQLLLPTVPLYA